MCVTTLSAQLSETRIGVWDVLHPEYGYRQVMAYQNAVQSLAQDANCMLLPVPSRHALGPAHIINTANDVELLMEMEKPFFPECRSFGLQNHVIQMGVYHIALLNDTSGKAAQEALEKIPAAKRPNIPEEHLEFYSTYYPGYPLLLCCFSNRDRLAASPVMIHFDPVHKNYFLFNTLDAHGSVPNLFKNIHFHQTIITGSYRLHNAENGFKTFDHSAINAELWPWLPKFGTAFKMNSTNLNRDIVLSTKAFSAEKINIEFGLLNKNGLTMAA